MAHLRLILLCVVGSGFANAGQLDRVNKIITADLETDIEKQGLSRLEFLDQLVDTFGQDSQPDIGGEDGDGDVRACTKSFNETLCSDVLYKNCYDVNDLLTSAIDNEEFNISDAFPTLVYHMYKPRSCETSLGSEPENHPEKMSSAKAWGYGLAFCFLIILISNIGGLMGPCMEKNYFQRLLLFFVALAVGTLAATGFLVLVPESMHLTGDDSPVPDYHRKMTTVMAGIYVFYTSELLMKMWFERGKTKKDKEAVVESDEKETLYNGKQPDQNSVVVSQQDHGHSHFPKPSATAQGDDNVGQTPVSTVAWMILTGDALHNFVDGISIGAAFTESTALGISVSIAILCEELPHELGDIAILLHAGLSMKRALLYNFLAAVVCLGGLVIGVMVGENTNANSWIFAAAGGMFIYISLVDMLPEMRMQAQKAIESNTETPMSVFLIQNLGLLVGFCIIAALVFFY